MGGDHAPGAAVGAALQARDGGVDILLVGDPDQVGKALKAEGAAGTIPVAAASEVVGMDEDPAIAVRAKPDASIRVCADLVADGQAAGLVSAGSTGATLTAALLSLGRLPGVRRPVVAVVLPVQAQSRVGVVLVDAGGSADVQADVLADHARMAVAYAQVRGLANPTVGLLNVGAEAGKGNALARAAHALLEGTDGFVGNVEPQAVLDGAVDVVVTDGFTGNIFLKALEAVHGAHTRQGHGPDEATAAVLLGVPGEVLIAHGDARADDVAAAVRTAVRVADAGLSRRVAERLAGTVHHPEQASAGLRGRERQET